MTADAPKLLKPGEVAAMFRVHRGTVARWGALTVIRTPGGDRRYREDEVLAMLASSTTPMIVSAGAAGEVALAGAPRPAAGAAQASMPAGRLEDAAPGLGAGGFSRPGAASQAPRTESRQR